MCVSIIISSFKILAICILKHLNEEKSYMQLHVPWILNGESTILRHLISHFQTQININYIQQMSTIWETYTVQVVWNCRYFYGTVSLKKPALIRTMRILLWYSVWYTRSYQTYVLKMALRKFQVSILVMYNYLHYGDYMWTY